MRKKIARKMCAALLTLVMVFTLVPAQAFASVMDNDPGYNEEILSALEQVVGSEDEAKTYYSTLQKYNLLDDDGNPVDSWTVTMDGKNITVDELREVLEGDYDSDKIVFVDGNAITLGNLDTIIQIEDYLSYLQETYFDTQEWSEAQLQSLESLTSQINEKGIEISNFGDTGEDGSSSDTPVGSSGVKHSARVSVSLSAETDTEATFAVSLKGAAKDQKVSFDWTALSADRTVSGTTSGTVSLTAGEDGTASGTITVTLGDKSNLHSSAKPVCYLKLDGIKNALFSNGSEAMSVKADLSATVNTSAMPTGVQTITRTLAKEGVDKDSIADDMNLNMSEYAFDTTLNFSSMTDSAGNALNWKLPSSVEISGSTTLIPNETETRSTDSWKTDFKITDQNIVSGAYFGYALMKVVNNSSQEIVSLECGYPIEGISGYTHGDTLTEPDATSKEDNKSASLTPETIGTKWTISGAFPMVQAYKESSKYKFNYRAYRPLTVKLTLTDKTNPAIESVSAPSATYYPGQVVPVTVTFSEPVSAESAKLTLTNGSELSAAETSEDGESGYSNILTFPYEVQTTDDAAIFVSGISAEDTSGNKVSETYDTPKSFTGVSLQTPLKSAAVTGILAQLSDAGDALNVQVQISDDSKLTTWLSGDMESIENGGFKSKSLKAYYNGTTYDLTSSSDTITGQTLTASIPITKNTDDEEKNHVIELMLDDSVVVGRYVVVTEAGVTYITKDNITAKLDILTATGTKYTFEDKTDPVIMIGEDTPTIKASFSLDDGTYTYGDETKTTVKGDSDESEADFVWESSNTEVAQVVKNGSEFTIVPTGKTGEAKITLTARNGGKDGKSATVTATYSIYVQGDDGPEDSDRTGDTLSFNGDGAPFLTLPFNDIYVEDGQSLALYWSSNIETEKFTITVERKDETKTYETANTSITIPGDDLKYDYTSGSNTLTLTVSAASAKKTYKDTATIRINATPAEIKLGELDSYYVLDSVGSVPITWSISNFDRAQSGDCFNLKITRDDTTVVNSSDNSGSYTLNIPAFTADSSDSTGYRQVYTVTVQARNGEDSTWSYDSFLLYVYDADTLKIMVDGAKSDGTLTMSNREKISSMSQDEILALKRDIYLKNVISANYGEYAWSELSDQLVWSSSDSSVASVNYQVNSAYENIENVCYTSYRPTEEFGISGESEGTATITVKHKLAGMQDSLDVKVETLADHLYLFQTYPQAKTKLTFEKYTDAGKTETKSVTTYSDEKGAAAYYAEYGIASDVYFQTTDDDGYIYTGTYHLENLESGEGDWTQLERYPCNNLRLRRAAYAYLYLKNPDGTPYTGKVDFRGGVYINGEYKKNAYFGLNSDTANKKGYEDTTVNLGSDGKLEVAMDQTQWDLDDNAVSADDSVSYVFEISESGKDDYYPVFVTVDATINEAAYVCSGDAVVNFRKNAESGEHPFIAEQTIEYPEYGTSTSLLDYTDTIGPGASLPEAELNTTVMWWGDKKTDNPKNKVQLYLADSNLPVCSDAGNYTMTNTSYPFSDCVITDYTVTLNESSMEGLLDTGEESGLVLEYYRDGTSLTRQEKLPFRLSNMIGAQTIEDDEGVTTQVLAIKENTKLDMSADPFADFPASTKNDQIIGTVLKLFASEDYDNQEKQKTINIQIAPTESPTRFIGLMQMNFGTMQGYDGQVTGVYATSETGDSRWYKWPFRMRDMLRFTKIYSQEKWAKLNADDYKKVTNHQGIIDFDYQVGGYMECEITYDQLTGWEINVLSGKFDLGGGVNCTWLWNVMAGYIPLTFSIKVGGTAEVTTEALSVNYTEDSDPTGTLQTGNDWLTQLRLYFYVGAFGGVGIDYSVVALKVGIYGQANADLTFEWLRRPYLSGAETHRHNAADNGTTDLLNASALRLNGVLGIEVVARFLAFSYERSLYSFNFDGKGNELLNKKFGDWNVIDSKWKANQAAYQKQISEMIDSGSASLMSEGDTQVVSYNLAPTLEDTGSDSNGDYAYANPIVSDDGSLRVSLAVDSKTNQPHVVYAKRGILSGDYGSDTEIPDADEDSAGYGDSLATVSGDKDFAVAAWTRQTKDIDAEAGDVVTTEDQLNVLNSTEVYTSVYDGKDWTTTRLSDNYEADLSPVTAAANGKAIAAWRSTASGSIDTLTEFDQKDNIVFKIWDGKSWSDEPVTLYNGTSGSVKALNAAILPDGNTAAIVYTLDKDEDSSTLTDREIAYAVVDLKTGKVTRSVVATNDAYLDENPQITAVKIDGNDRFVLGWYTQQTVSVDDDTVLDGGTTSSEDTTDDLSDIRLMSFDGSGVPTLEIPDSISKVSDEYDVDITSNFRFTKNADTIDNLSIVWVERDKSTISEDTFDDDMDSESSSTGSDYVEKDVLKSVKFYKNENSYSITGDLDVTEMEENTLIDHFDAYADGENGDSIKTVILGTTYGKNGKTVEKNVTLSDGKEATITVPAQSSELETESTKYTDSVSVEAVLAEYDTVSPGSSTQIYFEVENNGTDTVKDLNININGTKTSFEDLNILPGKSAQIYADYDIPAGKTLENPDYTVSASFEGGASDTAKGSILLNLPDLRITEAKIVKEEDGERVIQTSLGNSLDIPLYGSDYEVRLGFYTDSTCESELPGVDPVTISSDSDLAMIDAGGYSTQVTFDVNDYLKQNEKKTEELPDNGLTIYVKAELVDKDGAVQQELEDSNNITTVSADNLAARTGEDAIITSTLTSEKNSSTATVSIQNAHLSKTTSGNVIATLLDKNGNVLEQQQSYTSDDGLLTLKGEEKKTLTFNFDKKGASVNVSYTDMTKDEDDATLSSLTFSNIPGITLDSFVYNEQTKQYEASVNTTNLTGTAVLAGTNSTAAKAAVSANNGTFSDGSNALSENVKLASGTNTITVHVTAGDAEKTYVLTVENKISQGGEANTDSSKDKYDYYTFVDVPDDAYYRDAVNWAVENGVTTGTDAAHFSPDGLCTRAQAVTFLWRAAGSPKPETDKMPFADVASGSYYHDAVLWAVENGIAKGTSETTFSPDATCSRAQIVTFLWRSEKCPAAGTENSFTDVSTDAYYSDAVLWAVKEGITNGTSETTFSPDATCSRAQIVTFLWRCEK